METLRAISCQLGQLAIPSESSAGAAVKGAAAEVAGTGRHTHKGVKLKCFKTHPFAELPGNHLEIFSTFGKLRDQQCIKWHSDEKTDGNCTKLLV